MNLIDLLSLIAPLIALSILMIRDNVYAASMLIPASLVVAVVAFLGGFNFLALLVLLIYIGVVIVLIVVAASAIEQVREKIHVRRIVPLVVLSLIFPALLRGYPAITVGFRAKMGIIIKTWMPVIMILTVTMLVIVLVALNISRRGLAQ